MIQVELHPLSPSEVQHLKKWFADPGAEVFRKAVVCCIAQSQAECGRKMIESIVRSDHQSQDAAESAESGAKYMHTLAVLDQIKNLLEDHIVNKATVSLDSVKDE